MLHLYPFTSTFMRCNLCKTSCVVLALPRSAWWTVNFLTLCLPLLLLWNSFSCQGLLGLLVYQTSWDSAFLSSGRRDLEQRLCRVTVIMAADSWLKLYLIDSWPLTPLLDLPVLPTSSDGVCWCEYHWDSSAFVLILYSPFLFTT